MRISILILLVVSLAAGVSAQDFTPVTCPDGTTVTPQMTITLPSQSTGQEEFPEPYFVSVITGESIPTLAATDENAATTCAVQDGLAEMVSVSHGENQTIGLSPYSAWLAADTTTENVISLGEIAGATAIIIEGGMISRSDGEGDVYDLVIDAALVEPNMWLHASVLGIDESHTPGNPGIALLDDNGAIMTSSYDGCPTPSCENANFIGTSYSGIRVPVYEAQENDRTLWLPGNQNTFHLRVQNTGTEGNYTLVISMGLPISQAESLPAQAIDNGDGSWLVRCDGELAFENGIKLTLDTTTISAESPLTLTALGADSPVTMAVFTSPEEGVCVPPSDTISTYSVTLPEFNVAPTLNGAQITLESPPAYVLIGSAQPSPLSLLVEGWKTPLRQTLAAEENPDLASILQPVLTLDVTPGMINTGADVRVYAVAADDLADPAVGIVNDAGQPVTDALGQIAACNDAGIPDACSEQSTSLTGYSVTLAEGRVLPGASLDAMVHLSYADLLAQADPVQPRLHVAAADRTGAGGPVILLLSLTLGE